MILCSCSRWLDTENTSFFRRNLPPSDYGALHRTWTAVAGQSWWQQLVLSVWPSLGKDRQGMAPRICSTICSTDSSCWAHTDEASTVSSFLDLGAWTTIYRPSLPTEAFSAAERLTMLRLRGLQFAARRHTCPEIFWFDELPPGGIFLVVIG